MASYNKRGYRPKVKKEKINEEIEDLVDDGESTTAEVFESLDEGANKAEEFVSRNQNVILGFIGVAALAALAWWGYNEFMLAPKQQEAIVESQEADKYFDLALAATTTEAKDSLFMLSLDGVNGKYGFLKIADEYSGTDAANLAHYKAGMAYLNIGGDKYQKAIDHLNEYNGDDSVLAALAQAGIGDALVQANQKKDALPCYLKAAKLSDNTFTSPRYLLKAAQVALDIDDKAAAKKALEEITNSYPKAEEVTTAKVLLAQAQ